MAQLNIKIMPDPVLRKKAETVSFASKQEKDAALKIISDMFETMYANHGVGLAAPQVGISKQIIVLDTSNEDNKEERLVLINPKIIEKSDDMVVNEEGCLSIPGVYYEIPRPKKVKIEFYDQDFQKQVMSAEDSLLSRAFFHETDHLNGVLFTDYLSKFKQKRVKAKMEKLKKDLES